MPPSKRARLKTAIRADSPFFKLPPELRNVIYRLCLVHKAPQHPLYNHKQLRDDSLWVRSDEDLPTDPALLRTCKRIRHEARGIFLQENSLTLCLKNFDLGTVVAWLDASPSRAELYANSTIAVLPSKDYRVSPWEGLMGWIKAYGEGRARRAVIQLSGEGVPQRASGLWIGALRVFDRVDELLLGGITWENMCEELVELHTELIIQDERWK